MSYIPRVVDDELRSRLKAARTVLIEGPRACGKTETARQHSSSEVLLDVDASAREAARVDPDLVLEGDRPRLIDEWQIVPELWDRVRRASDDSSDVGQFVLTGSAAPADATTRHTGAGRVSRLRMRPLSLFEGGHSNGDVSIGALLASDQVRGTDPELSLGGIAELITRGGWPATVNLGTVAARRFVTDYLNEVRRADIGRARGTRRDPNRVNRLLRSLARNVSTEVSAQTLATDTGGSDGPLDVDTVRRYLDDLELVFMIEDQPAWAPHLRSRSRLRSSPKRHFVDPSLATAALRAAPNRLESDIRLFGLLFESLAIRDLRVYAQTRDAEVYHYRDNTGLEVDAVLETAEGAWLAIEVKLGGQRLIDQGARSLLRFAARVDTATMGDPSKLIVLTATGFAYERGDGVAVVPIGNLAP